MQQAQQESVRRLEDVRAAEIDKVQIASCFRPGDIVKAEVVSLGTSRDYYLSTAQNHLGVVYAKSLAGDAGTGCSVCMSCPVRAIECWRSEMIPYPASLA